MCLFLSTLYFPTSRNLFLNPQFQTASALRESVSFAHFTGSDAPEKDVVVLYRPKHLQTKLEPDHVKYDGEVKKVREGRWERGRGYGRHTYTLQYCATMYAMYTSVYTYSTQR